MFGVHPSLTRACNYGGEKKNLNFVELNIQKCFPPFITREEVIPVST